MSFASQQQRALHLVWALTKRDILKPDMRVAVVGAGLAGIMTSAALISLSHLVWLYETGSQPLSIQEQSHHRYVHPSVNTWPEMPLSATTEFPFFDWFSDVCADAIQRLRHEWVNYFEPHLSKFVNNTTVRRISRTTKGKIRIHPRNDKVAVDFDVVIVATGFGKEAMIPSRQSYWAIDKLEQLRGQQGKRFLVSGIGDGGLIETLRLLHNNFDKGYLCVRLARALDLPAIRSEITKTERSARDFQHPDERANFYKEKYEGILDIAPQRARDILDRSVNWENRIELVGKLRHPFQATAAPVHKIMIAHALASGAIVYRCGIISKAGRGHKISTQDDRNKNIISDLMVIRHGATPSLKPFLKQKEIQAIRERQEALGDFIEVATYDDAFFPSVERYPSRRQTPQFARFRLPLARSYVSKYLGVEAGIQLRPGDVNYEILVSVEVDSLDTQIPTNFFGIPATVKEREIADTLVRRP